MTEQTDAERRRRNAEATNEALRRLAEVPVDATDRLDERMRLMDELRRATGLPLVGRGGPSNEDLFILVNRADAARNLVRQLADEIDARLEDETRDRQSTAEYAAAQLRDVQTWLNGSDTTDAQCTCDRPANDPTIPHRDYCDITRR